MGKFLEFLTSVVRVHSSKTKKWQRVKLKVILKDLIWKTSKSQKHGSDISVSSVSSDKSDSDEEDRQNIQWSRILRPPEVEDFTKDTGASFVLDENCTELDFFLKFLPLTLLDHIVQETNAYAARCIQEQADRQWYDTKRSDMMAYFGLIVVMSIISVPSYILA